VNGQWRTLSVDYLDPPASIEDIVHLIEVSGGATGVAYSQSDVIEALQQHQPAAVTIASGLLVGAIVARVDETDAHLMTLAIHPDWRKRGIGSALLRRLDQEIIHRGARRLLAFIRTGQVGEIALSNQGFTHLDGVHLYLREASMIPEELAIVEQFGGQVLPSDLWGSLKGFSTAKDILDRRVVAPLAHTELAEQLGLVPPAAVMLFGPPGTGKTSFARAIASRLSWAFVEIHPSLLGSGPEGARALRDALVELGRVDRLVCFIDEADEIASDRGERPDSQSLVNELLKVIPTFKSRPNRLIVMATNSIEAIDKALLRPGRFDLVIPVGAPNEAERADLASEFLPAADPEDVASRTSGFTPADFALAAQRGAQIAFDRAVAGGSPQVSSEDVLSAIALTRASVSPDALDQFATEAERFSRL